MQMNVLRLMSAQIEDSLFVLTKPIGILRRAWLVPRRGHNPGEAEEVSYAAR